MPKTYKRYRSKGFKRRQYKGRNIFYRRGVNKSLYLAKKALSMLNVEYKRHYVQTTNNTINTTASITNLNIIGQGTGTNQRVGNQIKITSLYYNGLYKISAAASATTIRTIILLDKQVNEGIFSIGKLLRDTSTDDILVSSLNIDQKYRFKILFNELTMLSQEYPLKQIKKYIKLDHKVRYDASTGAVADQTTYGFYIVQVSNENTNVPGLTSSIAIRFIDN